MANNRLRLEGLDELRRALQNLPAHLTQEASGIIIRTAEDAKAEMIAAYPTGPTGNLKRGFRLDRRLSNVSASVILRNSAPHAWIFENGTQVRHTGTGANRGRMPPGRVFIPIAQRKRREMMEHLKALLVSEGLLVTDTGPS